MKLIQASDLKKISYEYGEPAAKQWWKDHVESMNRELTRSAKLGFKEHKFKIPSHHVVHVSSFFIENNFKVITSYEDGEGYTEIKVLW